MIGYRIFHMSLADRSSCADLDGIELTDTGNFALGRVDPRNFGMEHHRTTLTRLTNVHLGNSAVKILRLERP